MKSPENQRGLLNPWFLESAAIAKSRPKYKNSHLRITAANVSREHIACTLLESSGLKKAKTNRFVN